MILSDGNIKVDFVINLPPKLVHEWLSGNMPGAQRGMLDGFIEEERLMVDDDNKAFIGRNMVVQFRYYILSDDRTEVRAYCNCLFRHLLDERLVLVGNRFPEARTELCEAVEDDAMARLLPTLKSQCGIWRKDESRDGTLNPLVNDIVELLATGFDREELKDLCVEVKVDVDNFPERKQAIIRELTLHMNRNGRLGDLLEACRELRPNLGWPQLSNEQNDAADSEDR